MGLHSQNQIAVAEADWSRAPLSELMAHIVATHHQHLRLELPILQACLEKVYTSYRNRDFARLAALPGLFFLLQHELDRHMRHEERTLFPEIEAREKSAGAAPPGHLADHIGISLFEHDSIFDSFAETRRITQNYDLPSYADRAYRKLFHGLQALERDLRLHIHLENDILFPRALSL